MISKSLPDIYIITLVLGFEIIYILLVFPPENIEKNGKRCRGMNSPVEKRVGLDAKC